MTTRYLHLFLLFFFLGNVSFTIGQYQLKSIEIKRSNHYSAIIGELYHFEFDESSSSEIEKITIEPLFYTVLRDSIHLDVFDKYFHFVQERNVQPILHFSSEPSKSAKISYFERYFESKPYEAGTQSTFNHSINTLHPGLYKNNNYYDHFDSRGRLSKRVYVSDSYGDDSTVYHLEYDQNDLHVSTREIEYYTNAPSEPQYQHEYLDSFIYEDGYLTKALIRNPIHDPSQEFYMALNLNYEEQQELDVEIIFNAQGQSDTIHNLFTFDENNHFTELIQYIIGQSDSLSLMKVNYEGEKIKDIQYTDTEPFPVKYNDDGLLSSFTFSELGTDTTVYTFEYKKHVSSSGSFTIYPNPTSDFLNIETGAIIKEISIVNMMGQSMLVSSSPYINVMFLKKGTYFIRLETEEGQSIQKFVKI